MTDHTPPLGPLPEPNYPSERDYADAWTADQMRAYALQERAAERERCAQWLAWYDGAETRRSEAIRNGDHLQMAQRAEPGKDAE